MENSSSPKVQGLEFLSQFKHGSHTNLKKKTIVNADACAYLLLVNGPMKRKDIVKALCAWRTNPEMWFTYLFNTSAFGGYGFVGIHSLDRGDFRYMEFSCAIEHREPKPYFRKRLWYRMRPGVYSLTVEGLARMADLKWDGRKLS